jgi:pantetheine-phosphate adenylyltransferase
MVPDPRIAVCPGSYDPVTNGHVDVITRAAAMFDELVVAVVAASVRKSRSLFSPEERIEFIEAATAVVDFARERGAKAIVKGLRAISDFEYELEMNQLNRQLASDIESIYLMASPQYSFLSSSGVKEIATFGGDISDLVPEPVARRLKEALAR